MRPDLLQNCLKKNFCDVILFIKVKRTLCNYSLHQINSHHLMLKRFSKVRQTWMWECENCVTCFAVKCDNIAWIQLLFKKYQLIHIVICIDFTCKCKFNFLTSVCEWLKSNRDECVCKCMWITVYFLVNKWGIRHLLAIKYI